MQKPFLTVIAPSGCLQYFNSTSGTVQSFNYGTAGLQNGTRQIAGLNYGICIAMLPGNETPNQKKRKKDFQFHYIFTCKLYLIFIVTDCNHFVSNPNKHTK